MKDYDKNKEPSYLQYWDVKNLYGWTIPQKFSVNNFEWINNTSQFNEDFIKNFNEESDERYFLEVHVQYLGKLHELYNDVPFLPERMKMEKIEKLVAQLKCLAKTIYWYEYSSKKTKNWFWKRLF